MPDIEKITLPDGVTYDLSDAGALHLSELPTTAGTYALQVTLVSGVPTYTWVEQSSPSTRSEVYKSTISDPMQYKPDINYTMEITIQ